MPAEKTRSDADARLDLSGRTVVMSGGLRGVGAAMAQTFCHAGANVAVIARPALTDASSSGRVEVEEIEGSGGRGLVVRADIRHERSVTSAVGVVVAELGGLDVCLNNSSVLSLAGTESVALRAFDLMLEVNVRGAFVLTRACLPHLRTSDNPHVLSISPPLNMAPRWLGDHPPYTLSKYATTILALGWAVEFADDGVASNCLWPERTISTDNVVDLLGTAAQRLARDPLVMAHAARTIVSAPSRELTGQCLLDGDVLRGTGLDNLDPYGGDDPQLDLFVGG